MNLTRQRPRARVHANYISLKTLLLGLLVFSAIFTPLFAGSQTSKVSAAASNGTMNFQMRLLTGTGTVVPDGNYNVEFKIYDQANSTGSSQGSCSGDARCLWVETRTSGNVVRVVNGYFSVSLGSVTAFASTIKWDQPLWLGVRIGGTGSPSWEAIEMTSDGTATGNKIALTAVPYAFRASVLASSTSGNTGTLSFGSLTNNPVLTLPNETGTVCTNFATGSCAGTWIQNQSGSQQATSNFWISTTGRADTSFIAPLLDTTSGGLNIGTATATGITIGSTTENGTITLGQSTASNTINIGNAVGGGNTQTIGVGTSSTGTTNISLGSSAAGTIALTGPTTATGRSSGTSTVLSATTGAVGQVAVNIQGMAAQTANLLQLQNTVAGVNSNLSYIDASGNFEQLGYTDTPFGGIGNYSNLLVRTEDFLATWVTNGTTTGTTANDGASNPAPDSTTTADKLVSASNGAGFCQFSGTGAANTTSTFSVWLKTNSSTQAVDLRVDGGPTSCPTAATVTGTVKTVTATTTWQRFFVTQAIGTCASCNVKVFIFPGGTGGQGTIVAWGAQLTAGSNPQVYVRRLSTTITTANDGLVSNGTAIFQNSSNSTSAFQIQSASDVNVFTADTTGGQIVLGQANAGGLNGAIKFNFSGSSGSTTLTLANPGSNNFTLTIPTLSASANVCTTDAVCSLGGAGTNNYLTQVPSSNTANGAGANVISPTAASVVGLTVNGTTNATSADVLDIVSGVPSGTATNGILFNQNSAGTTTNGFQIQRTAGTLTNGLVFSGTIGTDIVGNSKAINITAAGTSIWQTTTGDLTLKTTAAASNLILDAGTAGNGTVTLGNSTANTISIGTNNAAHTIGIGNTGATGAQAITIGGNGNTGNTITIDAGTAANAIQIGNTNTAHGIQIGSNATGANAILLGGANSGSTTTIEGGTGAGSIAIGNGTTAHSIAIGNGGTSAQVINLGSNSTGSALNERVGTGNYTLDGNSASTYTLGATTTTGTFILGGASQTGTITIGQYNNTSSSTISIGSALASAGTQVVDIGRGTTGTGNITIGNTAAGFTTLQSPTTNINSATIATNATTLSFLDTNAATVTAFQAGTTLTVGATTGTFKVRNANSTIGNAAGSGVLTNNGATLNSTLALSDFATGGSIGSAASTVDIYTSISVNQTTASQTLSVPAPTASTTYGRLLYLSNIGSASYKIGSAAISPGATATLIWSHTTGGDSWQFAGADAGNIQGAYNNSGGGTTPEIKLDSTRGGVDIQDADSALNASLFTVRNSNSSGLGAAIFDIQSANPITDITNNATNNLVTNGSFEVNTTGWVKMGSTQAAVAQDTNQRYIGNDSLKVVTNATDASGTDGASYNLTTTTLVTNTTYNLTLYARTSPGTSFSTFEIGRAENGSTNTSCLTAQTVSGSGWTQFSCTFTTGTTSGTPYIYARQTDQVARTFYIDAVQLTRYSLLSNPYADQTFASGDWQAKSSATVTRDTTQNQAGAGTASVKIVTAANTASGVKHNITLNDSTLYYLSFYAKLDAASSALSTMEAGYSSDGSTDNTVCITGQTVVTTGWTNYTCTITTPSSHSGTPYFYVNGNVASARTFYVDNVVLTIGGPLSAYREGQIATNGIIGSPVLLQNQSDSTSAFQVQNNSGTSILTVNTTSGIVQIGSSTSNAGSTIFALNNNDGTTTPTEVDGGMYYNNSTSQFLCGENGFWVNCGVPPRDHSYDLYDEFMSGNSGSLAQGAYGIGGLNWFNSLIASPIGLTYNNNATTGNAPAADADRPGILNVEQTGTGNNTGQTTSLGIGSIKLGTSRIDLKTAVNVTAAQSTVLIGLHNETTATTAPTTGVYWKEASNGTWQYCYVNATPAETCANSSTTATAGTWYRLEIIIVSSSEVDYYVNGTKTAATGITYNTTNRVAPAYTSYKTSGTPTTQDLYLDYFELLGTTSTAR